MSQHLRRIESQAIDPGAMGIGFERIESSSEHREFELACPSDKEAFPNQTLSEVWQN